MTPIGKYDTDGFLIIPNDIPVQQTNNNVLPEHAMKFREFWRFWGMPTPNDKSEIMTGAGVSAFGMFCFILPHISLKRIKLKAIRRKVSGLINAVMYVLLCDNKNSF